MAKRKLNLEWLAARLTDADLEQIQELKLAHPPQARVSLERRKAALIRELKQVQSILSWMNRRRRAARRHWGDGCESGDQNGQQAEEKPEERRSPLRGAEDR